PTPSPHARFPRRSWARFCLRFQLEPGRNGWEKRQFLALRFATVAGNPLHSKTWLEHCMLTGSSARYRSSGKSKWKFRSKGPGPDPRRKKEDEYGDRMSTRIDRRTGPRRGPRISGNAVRPGPAESLSHG